VSARCFFKEKKKERTCVLFLLPSNFKRRPLSLFPPNLMKRSKTKKRECRSFSSQVTQNTHNTRVKGMIVNTRELFHFPELIKTKTCVWFFLILGIKKAAPQMNVLADGRAGHECNMRSKIRWFTEPCNSHYVSPFAAFFIVTGTKISIVKSCFFFVCYRSISFSSIENKNRVSPNFSLRIKGNENALPFFRE